MKQNNNLSILPFYDSLDKQLYKKFYAYGEIYPIIVPHGFMIPFQMIRDIDVNSITSVKAVSLTGTEVDLSTDMLPNMSKIVDNVRNIDIIKHKHTTLVTNTLDEGLHYLQMTDTVNTYYSEIFSVTRQLNTLLKIEYWDYENLVSDVISIDYTDDYKHIVYLKSAIGKPGYEFEEVVTDRDGYSFIEKQVSEKTYKFTFLATEAMCDAMRIIRMSDNILITYDGIEYDVDSFLITPKWEADGYIASVETEFQCDTVIKKTSTKYINISEDSVETGIKMYIGVVQNPQPSEAAIKLLTELEAIRQTTSAVYSPNVGDYKCFAYPASFGLLSSAYVFQGWEMLGTLEKYDMTFTFDSSPVSMYVYVSKVPVTLDLDLNLTMTFKFD